MLPSFFIACFEFLHGSQDPVFRDQVYVPAGFWLLVLSVALGVLYYYVLNWVWARFSRTWPHWVSMGLLNIILNGIALLAIEWSIPQLHLRDPASLGLLLIDALYAFFGFLLVSLMLKWASPHARRTPF